MVWKLPPSPTNHFLQMEPQSCRPPTQHPTRPHLWPLRRPHREKSHLCPFLSLKCTGPPSRRKERTGGTALWHCVKTGSQHYASRQTKIWTPWHYANGGVWLVLTWLHTTLLISIIRYSNGCWVRGMQLEQSRKNSQSEILIVVLSPHDPFGWLSERNTTC